jgi:hypothetical protein
MLPMIFFMDEIMALSSKAIQVKEWGDYVLESWLSPYDDTNKAVHNKLMTCYCIRLKITALKIHTSCTHSLVLFSCMLIPWHVLLHPSQNIIVISSCYVLIFGSRPLRAISFIFGSSLSFTRHYLVCWQQCRPRRGSSVPWGQSPNNVWKWWRQCSLKSRSEPRI